MVFKTTNRALKLVLGAVFTLAAVDIGMSAVPFALMATYQGAITHGDTLIFLGTVQTGLAAVVVTLPGLLSPITRMLAMKGNSNRAVTVEESGELGTLPRNER